MNYIMISMLAMTALPILFGALLGAMRGSRRALLRLVLVVLSIVLAFALYSTVAKILMNMEVSTDIGEMKMQDYMKEKMMESMPESLADFAIPLIQSIMQVLIFLMLFFIFWFITWLIVFPICKIFVKPRKIKDNNGNVVKTQRHRLIGSAIGAVQGVIVAVCVGIVFTGLLVQTNSVMMAMDSLSDMENGVQTMDLEEGEGDYDAEEPDHDNDPDIDIDEDDGNYGQQPSGGGLMEGFGEYSNMINDYANSWMGKFYGKIGAKPFNKITQVELENGRKITLSGQIEAIRGVVDMAKELMNLQNIDFAQLLEEGNINALTDIFNKLGEINDNLSPEAKETISGLLKSVADEMVGDSLGIDFSDVDISNIDFKKEGEVFQNLYEYKGKDEFTTEDVKGIVDNLAESDLILDVLQQGNANFSELDDEHLGTINDRIDELESSGDYSQEKIDALRDLFKRK